MNNIAVMIPCASWHFNYLNRLLVSIQTYRLKFQYIFVIFTSRTECDSFNTIHPNTIKIIPIFYDELYKDPISGEANVQTGIVNRKCFIGLDYIYNTFLDVQYVYRIDAQSQFLCEFDVSVPIIRKYTDKLIYASLYNRYYQNSCIFKVMSAISTLFSAPWMIDYYWLMSSFPIYKRSIYKDFRLSINIENIDFFLFEMMVYQGYLLVHQGFEILDFGFMSPIPTMSVAQSFQFLSIENKKKYLQLTNPSIGYLRVKDKQLIHKQGIVMALNLDRII